jgi:Flp pilus assembly pilin Flp
MKPYVFTSIKEIRRSPEVGSSFVETAVVLALIAAIVVGTVRDVGQSSNTTLEALHLESGSDSTNGMDPEGGGDIHPVDLSPSLRGFGN